VLENNNISVVSQTIALFLAIEIFGLRFSIFSLAISCGVYFPKAQYHHREILDWKEDSQFHCERKGEIHGKLNRERGRQRATDRDR
jgi:hypothetical protein